MSYGSFIPTGSFDVDEEIARHSKMSMSMPEKAKSDRDFANSQTDLVNGAAEAKANGDSFSEKDYSLRHDYANVLKNAAASQDNYNRYRDSDEKHLAIDAWEHRELYKERLLEIRQEHEELLSQARSPDTDRDLNSIDDAPGEDRAKKAVWDQKQLRAEGEAARARGDNATKTDCALRWNFANAQAAGDTEKLAKIRTEHETFRARAAQSGREFNHIDQRRGEDPARKAVWEQGRLSEQKGELDRAAEVAKQNGDRWEMTDCQIRAAHADAKLGQDANKAQQIESIHRTFQARTESETGRKFNDLSQPRGEDADLKVTWEQNQGRQARPDQSQAEPFRNAAREAPGRVRTEAPSHVRRDQKGQAARMQEVARNQAVPVEPKPAKSEADIQADLKNSIQDAVKVGDHAKYRDCDMRLSHIEAKQSGDVSSQESISRQHKVLVEEVNQATGREFNAISAPQGENSEKKSEWDKRESNREYYSESNLSPSEKAEALTAHQGRQDQLLAEAREATERGDGPTEYDRWTRHSHAEATRNSGLHNDDAMEAERNGQPERAEQHRAKRNTDASTVDHIAAGHERFRERTEQQTGRQFNALSQPPGEKKNQAEQTQNDAPISKLDAVKARARERAQQEEATGQVQPAKVRTGYKTSTQREEAKAPDEQVKPDRGGPRVPHTRAAYLKENGATSPEFIKLVSEDSRYFAHARQHYEARSKGFDNLRTQSRELAAQPPDQSQGERQKPGPRR